MKAAPSPDDADKTEAIIRKMVKRKMPLFRHFPDFGLDDGLQICRIAVEQARPDFDTSKNWGTWVGTICARRMIDAWRRRVSQSNREAKSAANRDYAGQRDGRRTPVIITAAQPAAHDESRQTLTGEEVTEAESFEGEFDIVEGEIVADSTTGPTLAEWFSTVVRKCRRFAATEIQPSRRCALNRQGHTYEPWHKWAVKAIAQKNGTSVRGTRGLFEDREDLRKLIGFDKTGIPCHGWFQKAVA